MPTPALPVDTAAFADTVVADSVVEPRFAMVITRPADLPVPPPRQQSATPVSWVLVVLLLLFLVLCGKFGKSRRYMNVLLHELTETRRRSNMFDPTVRENSFLLLLNIQCFLSMGVLLYGAVAQWGIPSLPPGGDTAGAGMGLCMGLCLLWGGVMWCVHRLSGAVFADAEASRLWARGYASCRALVGIPMLVAALLSMFYHSAFQQIIIVAGILYAIAEIVFIFKGARIFLSGPASCVLFFYYLCTLEIAPLIVVYVGAVSLCGNVL